MSLAGVYIGLDTKTHIKAEKEQQGEERLDGTAKRGRGKTRPLSSTGSSCFDPSPCNYR